MLCWDKLKNADKELLKTRRAILKIYGCILFIGLAYYLWVIVTGVAMPCLYYKTTGLLCPGCGISRMFMSILKFDFVSAFSYNPVCFCLFFLWNVIAVLCYIDKPKFIKTKLFLYTALCFSVILLLIFCIIRNI